MTVHRGQLVSRRPNRGVPTTSPPRRSRPCLAQATASPRRGGASGGAAFPPTSPKPDDLMRGTLSKLDRVWSSTTTSTTTSSSPSSTEKTRQHPPLPWGAVSESLSPSLSPAWKMTLLSDGSVTRHVELLTGRAVRVECLEMREVESWDSMSSLDSVALPRDALEIAGPVLQRQVLLYSEAEPDHPLVYAVSWWNKAKAEAFLTDVKSPIWVNLSENKTELYREVKALYRGKSEELQGVFGCGGQVWGRHYCFWHAGEPLTVIYEAFSNKLDDYISDTSICEPPAEDA